MNKGDLREICSLSLLLCRLMNGCFCFQESYERQKGYRKRFKMLILLLNIKIYLTFHSNFNVQIS